jgi:hypothetical protein
MKRSTTFAVFGALVLFSNAGYAGQSTETPRAIAKNQGPAPTGESQNSPVNNGAYGDQQQKQAAEMMREYMNRELSPAGREEMARAENEAARNKEIVEKQRAAENAAKAAAENAAKAARERQQRDREGRADRANTERNTRDVERGERNSRTA